MTYVGAGTFVTRTGAGSINPSIPGGANGDLLIAQVLAREELANVTMTGWNLLFDETPVANYQTKIYWRIATGGDPNTVNQSGTTNSLVARITRFSGIDPTAPIRNAGTTGAPAQLPAANSSTQASSQVRTGTETTVIPDEMLVIAAFNFDDSLPAAPPGACGVEPAFTTLTNAYVSTSTAGNDSAIWQYYALQNSAGLKGTFCQGQNNGNDRNTAVLFALKPNPATYLTINVPAGTTTDDVMVASISVRGCSAGGGACTSVITPPSGWTQIGITIDQTFGGGTGNRLAIYQRVVTGAEPANYSWYYGAGTPLHSGAVGVIGSYTGVDTANPVLVEGGQATASSGSHSAPSIDTGAFINTLLISTHTTSSAVNWSAPGGMTLVNSSSSLTPENGGGISMAAYRETFAGPGVTGVRTATYNTGVPGADTGATHMLALRPRVDHFSITHSGSGIACDDHTITLTAHGITHGVVSTGGIAVTLGASLVPGPGAVGSWISILSGGGSLSDPTPGDGAATYTFPVGGSSSQLAFRYANLSGTSATVNFSAVSGAISETSGFALASDDLSFTIAQAGFRFRNITDASNTIPTQIAGKPSNVGLNAKTIRLQAIRTDTSTLACATGFPSAGVRNVQMGAECNNPSACAGRQVSIINNAITTALPTSNDDGNAATVVAYYTTGGGVPLTFNANSEADIVITYPDAGQISLFARYDLDPLVAGFEMSGGPSTFVVRPFGFVISGVTTSATPGPTQPVLTKSGQDFNAAVTAVVWKTGDDANADGVPDTDTQISGNAATPNFGKELSPATATLSHTLNAPSGGAAGALGGTTTYTAFGSVTPGSKTQAVNWSEVGFINLFAVSTNYLSTGQTIRNSTTGLTGVGRFYPDHFLATPGTLTNRQQTPACSPASNFTYEGEPFRVTFMLTARNALTTPTATSNYSTSSGYARLDGTVPANFGFGAVDLADATPPLTATALTSRVVPGTSSGTWTAGTGNFTADVTLNRATTPDGPFESFRLGVLPVDADLVTLRAADLDLDTDVPNNGNDRVLAGSTSIRFGRLRLGNVSGSPSLKLNVPIEAQYWNSMFYVTSTGDSCTTLATTDVGLGNQVGGGSTAVTAVSTLAAGRGAITLAAPTGVVRSVDVALNLGSGGSANACPSFTPTTATAANKTFLQGKWCGATATRDPVARARFGVRRSDESIYNQEKTK